MQITKSVLTKAVFDLLVVGQVVAIEMVPIVFKTQFRNLLVMAQFVMLCIFEDYTSS